MSLESFRASRSRLSRSGSKSLVDVADGGAFMVVLFQSIPEASWIDGFLHLERSSVIHLELLVDGGGTFMVGRLGNGGRSDSCRIQSPHPYCSWAVP